MASVVYALAGLSGLALAVGYSRWHGLTARERFFLGLKEAATPGRLSPEEKARLELLRSPWWAIWVWLPDLWRRPPS